MAINVSVQCSGGQIFLSLQPMKQYIITTLFDDVLLLCSCFALAFCSVSLHGD